MNIIEQLKQSGTYAGMFAGMITATLMLRDCGELMETKVLALYIVSGIILIIGCVISIKFDEED